MATVMVTANSRNTPHHAAHQQHRMNTAINANVIDMMVKPISREPLSAASNGRMPLRCGGRCFQHHDGVVDHEPTDSVSASKVMLLIE